MDKRQDKSALAFSPLPRPSGTRRGSFQPPDPALLFVAALKPGAILLCFFDERYWGGIFWPDRIYCGLTALPDELCCTRFRAICPGSCSQPHFPINYTAPVIEGRRYGGAALLCCPDFRLTCRRHALQGSRLRIKKLFEQGIALIAFGKIKLTNTAVFISNIHCQPR